MRRLYGIFAATVFVTSFLLLFPCFWLFLQHKRTFIYAHSCNRIWTKIVFFLCGIGYEAEWRFQLSGGETCVFCANHTSFVDIPAIYRAVPGSLAFIGKSSLGKVPLFGYMYSRLHILVNRRSIKSKQEVYERSLKALEEGTHMVVFPEGTISKSGNPPGLLEFKDGAFRMAIEKQVPLVPVTIPFNWIILKDDGRWLPQKHICKVIMHEKIDTKDMHHEDIPALKARVKEIIATEFARNNKIGS